MSGYELDVKTFERRIKTLFEAWNNKSDIDEFSNFKSAQAIIVPVGDLDDDSTFKKSTSLQNWLLGFEFPTTITIFLPNDTVIFIASSTKTKILKQLENSSINVELVTKTKDAEANKKALSEVVKRLESKTIGVFSKEEATGKSIDEWNTIAKDKLGEETDITPSMAAVMASKDKDEQKLVKQASQLSSHLLKFGIDKIMSIIDSEKKITHSNLADIIERKTLKNEDETDAKDKNFWSKLKTFNEIDFATTENVYTPIIQSGGNYNLKPSAMSDDNNLKPGVITSSLGMRYKSYCSNIGRTFFIDPHKSQESNYQFLLDLQKKVLSSIKPGNKLSNIYNIALEFTKKTKPELEDKLTKNIGFLTGIYFRDSSYLIGPKNNRRVENGMVFNLAIGFSDIQDPKNKGKTYALSLIDTVLVTEEGGVCLTEGNKSSRDVMLFLENEDDDDSEVEEVKKKPSSPKKSKRQSEEIDGAVVGNRMLRGKTRNAGKPQDQTTANKIKEHQKILHAAKNEEGLKRFVEGVDSKNGSTDQGFKRFDSYKREQQVPINRDLRIFIDSKAQSVILPINGFIVPVHVSTIKNASKTEEGAYMSLRINFITPGQVVGKKEETPFEDPDSMFIRSVTFRSTDKLRFSDLHKDITELKKIQTKKAAEKREMADVVEQEKLNEIKGRRPIRLGEVFARPIEGKRLAGDLDIHANGVRYSTPSKDQRIDVLFSNVKHFFFQPCDNELIVIIHFHLKHPIMIGKKKTRDVQFYREASDVQFDETGNRKRKIRYGDEDEIELEQEERRRRQALNREFKSFSEKVAEASEDRFDVDIPYRELGFQGVPNRTGVLLQPTTECLVQLTDPPFTVVTLSEIEIAHLERVSFGLKSFDLVFVFQDFSKPVLHINSIQVTQLDNVKEWLDSSEIPISEGPASLNWSAVMKTVNEDPKDFFESGGWSFLGTGDNSDNESEESEQESTYSVSSDGFDDDDESGESDEFDESASDSGSEASMGSEESGESWEALERRAERDDNRKIKKSGGGSDDEQRTKSKSKRR